MLLSILASKSKTALYNIAQWKNPNLSNHLLLRLSSDLPNQSWPYNWHASRPVLSWTQMLELQLADSFCWLQPMLRIQVVPQRMREQPHLQRPYLSLLQMKKVQRLRRRQRHPASFLEGLLINVWLRGYRTRIHKSWPSKHSPLVRVGIAQKWMMSAAGKVPLGH